MYPWPSFGGFLFIKEEHAVWGTDAGWTRVANFQRSSPLGADSDVLTALNISSYDRSFEIYLTPERFDDLEALMNSTAEFTDWSRPIPDSRTAVLVEVSAIEDVISSSPQGTMIRKRHTKVSLVTV